MYITALVCISVRLHKSEWLEHFVAIKNFVAPGRWAGMVLLAVSSLAVASKGHRVAAVIGSPPAF